MPMAAVVKLPPLFNVSSMKLLIVNQCVSNSCFDGKSYSSGATRHLPYLRGGIEYQ